MYQINILIKIKEKRKRGHNNTRKETEIYFLYIKTKKAWAGEKYQNSSLKTNA